MRVVILGAGISGHTVAAFIKKKLGKKHDVIVVSPSKYYQWVPSNIWVGVGRMNVEQVRFDLNKIYNKWKIDFRQAKATAIYPEGNASTDDGLVEIEYTIPERQGEKEMIAYDFLVNATGPKLNFEATEGLGPEKYSQSVCSYSHASQSWAELQKKIELMKQGKRQKFLIGTGHGSATCQGAAFEYALNIEFELRKHKVRDLANITWISNEYELGDFGMGGAFIKRGGYITSTKIFTESLFAEKGIHWIKRAAVKKVEENGVHFETLTGEQRTKEFDFAMLIPSFTGHDIKAYNKTGEDITSTLFAPNKFMKVDADYTKKPYEEWKMEDWPEIYQNPTYHNIYAAGIAFAPPHGISKPMVNPNGLMITPAPPRTGMPSGVTGKIIASNIADRIKKNTDEHKHRASMGTMGAACIVSAGYGMTNGLGASMTVAPIVPDWDKYPRWGRDISKTIGEIGLSGHWVKLFLHYMFLHKAKGYPFWWLVPE